MARPIKFTGVTIHHWGNDGQRFDDVANYLCHSGGNTSAHTVLQADRVAALVSPDNAAWHAGAAVCNATTIGIECRPESTDADAETLCQYIAYLEGIYRSLNVYVHQDWYRTACPGRYFAKQDAIMAQVNKIRSGASSVSYAASVTESTPATSSVVQPFWIVEAGDTWEGIAGYYGFDTDYLKS